MTDEEIAIAAEALNPKANVYISFDHFWNILLSQGGIGMGQHIRDVIHEAFLDGVATGEARAHVRGHGLFPEIPPGRPITETKDYESLFQKSPPQRQDAQQLDDAQKHDADPQGAFADCRDNGADEGGNDEKA